MRIPCRQPNSCSERDLPYGPSAHQPCRWARAPAPVAHSANCGRRPDPAGEGVGGMARGESASADDEIRMRRHFFITGTDTGVGKTTLAALLCAALDAVYWKPIQTGTLEGSDRVTVMRLAGIGTDRTLDEVYKFVPPVSPDLAARWAGVEIDLNRLNLPTSLMNDWLIVEGAGGVLVPINSRQFMLDMMVK